LVAAGDAIVPEGAHVPKVRPSPRQAAAL